MTSREIEGQLKADGLKFGIVAARFNGFITESLVSGAMDCLIRHGASKDDITTVRVPGSFEIPLICKHLAESGSYDALIALGAVIRGGTSHYELVCRELSSGLAKVSLDSGIPVSFGVLTTENIEQAIERAGTKAGNKGVEAAMAAIETAQVIRALR
jgi:6,7-dimethyl-8-ribityllumazine synthase